MAEKPGRVTIRRSEGTKFVQVPVSQMLGMIHERLATAKAMDASVRVYLRSGAPLTGAVAALNDGVVLLCDDVDVDSNDVHAGYNAQHFVPLTEISAITTYS